ncbi:MAG: cold shock domain-containing protein [Phycisphaerales bacterium]|nr:cold shock domain-containing protein [Phycisphaerales bacterium]
MKDSPGTTVLQDVEGTVKWFDPRKGFGFIVGPEEQDIFVHFTQIEGDGFRVLKDGCRVRYSAERGDKGWHATKVERIDEPDVRVRSVGVSTRNPRRTV